MHTCINAHFISATVRHTYDTHLLGRHLTHTSLNTLVT